MVILSDLNSQNTIRISYCNEPYIEKNIVRCKYCRETFGEDKRKLKNHLKFHCFNKYNGGDPVYYHKQGCWKIFKTSDELEDHVLECDFKPCDNSSINQCPVCKRPFHRRGAYIKHPCVKNKPGFVSFIDVSQNNKSEL